MFGGHFYHTVDEKNRFKVPMDFREELGIKVYLIPSPDDSAHCIYMYNEAGWEDFCNRLSSDDRVHTQDTRRLTRRIMSSVVYAEVDKGGRITMGADIKKYLGDIEQVHIVGNLKHIEIWSPEEWFRDNDIEVKTSVDSLNLNI